MSSYIFRVPFQHGLSIQIGQGKRWSKIPPDLGAFKEQGLIPCLHWRSLVSWLWVWSVFFSGTWSHGTWQIKLQRKREYGGIPSVEVMPLPWRPRPTQGTWTHTFKWSRNQFRKKHLQIFLNSLIGPPYFMPIDLQASSHIVMLICLSFAYKYN